MKSPAMILPFTIVRTVKITLMLVPALFLGCEPLEEWIGHGWPDEPAEWFIASIQFDDHSGFADAFHKDSPRMSTSLESARAELQIDPDKTYEAEIGGVEMVDDDKALVSIREQPSSPERTFTVIMREQKYRVGSRSVTLWQVYDW